MQIFFLSGIVVSVFLALLLLLKRGKTASERLLLAWLALIAVHLSLYYKNAQGDANTYTFLLGIELPLPLFQGPFLWLYTIYSLREEPRFNKRDLLHFLPGLLCYFSYLDFFGLSAQEKLWVYAQKGAGYETVTAIIGTMVMISGVCYIFFSILKVWGHKLPKPVPRNQQFWLQFLSVGMAVIWLSILGNSPDWLIYSSVVLFVLALGIISIQHVGLFGPRGLALAAPFDLAVELDEAEQANTAEKYANSNLDEGQLAQLAKVFEELMAAGAFRDPELNLNGLAQEMNTTPHHLSQMINTVKACNFNDCINQYRVEEFIRKAQGEDAQKFTLLALAMECGFNSKSAFNRNFKRVTGESPSAFLEAQKAKNL